MPFSQHGGQTLQHRDQTGSLYASVPLELTGKGKIENTQGKEENSEDDSRGETNGE